MAYFKDADDLYAHLGKLFRDIVADDEIGARFQRADTVVQYRMRNPDTQLTVRVLKDAEREVELGATQIEPEVVMAMDADTAHRYWLGAVNVTLALARGHISARGPVAKILQLVPLAEPVMARYRAQLEADGREDLASV